MFADSFFSFRTVVIVTLIPVNSRVSARLKLLFSSRPPQRFGQDRHTYRHPIADFFDNR